MASRNERRASATVMQFTIAVMFIGLSAFHVTEPVAAEVAAGRR
jgi:hypothetical protein